MTLITIWSSWQNGGNGVNALYILCHQRRMNRLWRYVPFSVSASSRSFWCKWSAFQSSSNSSSITAQKALHHEMIMRMTAAVVVAVCCGMGKGDTGNNVVRKWCWWWNENDKENWNESTCSFPQNCVQGSWSRSNIVDDDTDDDDVLRKGCSKELFMTMMMTTGMKRRNAQYNHIYKHKDKFEATQLLLLHWLVACCLMW